jgi:hypothetical protein
MITKELLDCACDLLLKKGWTRGHYAIDKAGESVPWFDSKAVAFCMIGAIFHCADADGV